MKRLLPDDPNFDHVRESSEVAPPPLPHRVSIPEERVIYRTTSEHRQSVFDMLASNDRFEQMEIENYSLKKRCRRLEKIVSQLLENKEQMPTIDLSEHNISHHIRQPDHSPRLSRQQSHSPRYSDIIPTNHSFRINESLAKVSHGTRPVIPSDGHQVLYLKREDSPTYQQSPIDTTKSSQRRIPDIASPTTSSPTSAFTPTYSRASSFDVSKRSPSPPPVSILDGRSSPQVSDDGHGRSASFDVTNPSSNRHSSSGDWSPKSHIPSETSSDGKKSPKSPRQRVKEESKDEPLSLEEMERQNEIFRSTYYEHGKRPSSTQNPGPVPNRFVSSVPTTRVSPSGRLVTEKISVSDALAQPAEIIKAYPPRRYTPPSPFLASRSPEPVSAKHLDRRSPEYEVHVPRHQYISDRYRIPVSNNKSRQVICRPHDIPGTVINNEITIVHTPKYSDHSPPIDMQARRYPDALEPPHKRSRSISSLKDEYARHPQSPHAARPFTHQPPRLITTDTYLIDSEQAKYNSDFYRKLPPKLHIVESQSDNGVTLTWNSTSNTDCSLVKSYHLFSRELFGYKVGTMKCMGIVEALPLPMSCNIDNLKPNVKYKFAVCAVDIYGRFGKMSNFTGKFELKQKKSVEDASETENDKKGTVPEGDGPKVSDVKIRVMSSPVINGFSS